MRQDYCNFTKEKRKVLNLFTDCVCGAQTVRYGALQQLQYDADQQLRKVTVLFSAAANRPESMNWVLVAMHCGMLPSEQDVQFNVTYGG